MSGFKPIKIRLGSINVRRGTEFRVTQFNIIGIGGSISGELHLGIVVSHGKEHRIKDKIEEYIQYSHEVFIYRII